MALTKCPDCGTDVSDAATACIHCGRPMTAPPQTAKQAVDKPPLLSMSGKSPNAATSRFIILGGLIVLLIGVVALKLVPRKGHVTYAGGGSGEVPQPVAPQPVRHRLALMDENALEVGPGRYMDYAFSAQGENCHLSAHVVGLAGSNKDLVVHLFGDDDYTNWKTNNITAGLFNSPKQAATTVDVDLAEGHYHFVISNIFSSSTTKVVQAHGEVTCVRYE